MTLMTAIGVSRIVDDRNGEVAEESKCHEALLIVFETVIFERIR